LNSCNGNPRPAAHRDACVAGMPTQLPR
jgi:hypothetical protein